MAHSDAQPHEAETSPTAQAPIRFLSVDEVAERTSLSRRTIYNRIDPDHKHYDPAFPKKVSTGHRRIAFVESEITSWQLARMAERGE